MRRFISAPGLTIFFSYTLFISSTFTIAGQDASIVFLYLLGIYSLIRQRKWPDMSHPLLWMFLLFTAISLVSGIFNQYEVDTLMNLRNNWRFIFPFVLLTAMYQVDEKNLLKTYYGFWLFIALYGIVQFLPVSTGSVLKNQASQHPIWDLEMAPLFFMRKETLPITSLLVDQCCYVVLWRRHSFF